MSQLLVPFWKWCSNQAIDMRDIVMKVSQVRCLQAPLVNLLELTASLIQVLILMPSVAVNSNPELFR